MGFEPMRDLHLLAVFETAPFNHLGTSPAVVIISLTLLLLYEIHKSLSDYFLFCVRVCV